MASSLPNGPQRPGMGSRRRGNDGVKTPLTKTEQLRTGEIHHLIWTGGVLDCFRGCDGAPCRGWITAFAGMTEMGDFGTGALFDTIRKFL